MINESYPHYEINVIDESIFTPVVSEFLPLHRPVYPMKTQRGPVGVPQWCPSIVEARRIFGEETFNEYSTYFSKDALFLNTTFPRNGAFIVRLADDATADNAWCILEVGAAAADVIQYQKDADGNRILDANGDPVPEDDGAGGDLTESGLELTWRIRTTLNTGEDFDNLVPYTVAGPPDVTWYPWMTFKASTPGAWGNDAAFQLWYDDAENEIGKVDRAGALYFNFAPTMKEASGSGVDPIIDKYNNTFSSGVLKPDVIDESIAMRVSIGDILSNAYDPDSNKELPYTIKVYSSSIEALGEAIIAVEVNRTDMLDDGWYVNPVSLVDIDNKPYDHVVLSGTSLELVKDVNNYLASGVDGNITDPSIETLFVDFLELTMNPDIVDEARYPFTHLIDTGWTLQGGKYAMCDFLATRQDVKVVLSTQTTADIGTEYTVVDTGAVAGEIDDEDLIGRKFSNVAGEVFTGTDANTPAFIGQTVTVHDVAAYNDEATDNSVGAALRARALLIPESIIKGTGCCRASIFQQAGQLATGTYKGIVPATIWYAYKLADYHNTDRMSQAPEGLPNSRVDFFKSWNWAPSSDDQKRRSWDGGLNYFQYADRNKIHYASLHSVYVHDTSVLAIDDYTNAIVYTKHAMRLSWAKHTGLTLPASDLQALIQKDLSGRVRTIYNSRYNFTLSVYQTDQEQQLGYVDHVRLELVSPANHRVWAADLVAQREGFEG